MSLPRQAQANAKKHSKSVGVSFCFVSCRVVSSRVVSSRFTQQVAYSWTGANVSGGSRVNASEANFTAMGVCLTDGDGGLSLTVTPGKPGNHTLSLFAGAMAGSHAINATLTDGGVSARYSEVLVGVAADLGANIWSNVRWNLAFETTTGGGALTVQLAAPASNGHYVSPPAPPPLPACAEPLCGKIEPFAGKVDLTAVGGGGGGDWVHYGDLKAAQTIQGKPLPYSASGAAAVPSDPSDKTDWVLAGGATLVGSKAAGLTDLRSGAKYALF